jgi:hypothetical protein
MEKTSISRVNIPRTTLYKLAPRKWLTNKVITEVIAHFFMILFLYTGIAKFAEFDVFQEQLHDSPLLSAGASILAWLVPISEFIIAGLLFFPRLRIIGFYASFVLMLCFTGYVIYLLTRDEQLPCSCGGIIEELSWTGHLIFNSCSIGLALIGLIIERRAKFHKQPS